MTIDFPPQAHNPFTEAQIKGIKGNPDGVYGIFRQGCWIYIGKGDIKARLLAHLGGDNPRITHEKPTHWVDAVLSREDDRTTWEKTLIARYDPVANRQVG